jgi:glucose/arabinose dehydrogenase/PKD repeat protein
MNKLFKSFALKVYFFIAFNTIHISPTQSQLPNGFTDVKIQGGYSAPMGVGFTKDGKRMFVWERKGVIWVSTWNGTTYVKQNSAVIDIQDEVGEWGDFGFHSVALDPNFDSNGLIYLFYQVDRHHLLNFGTSQYSPNVNDYNKASISRVTRYRMNNNNGVLTADPSSRKVLIGESKSTGIPILFESHGGGQLLFGADGTLLISTGDNASFNGSDVGNASETYHQQAINDGIMRAQENVGALRAQMLNSMCGKILRIDPNTGDGVTSNPHYDGSNPRSAKSRVWALGFRNPYRMAFKTGTGSANPSNGNPGTIIVGDVGFAKREEVNIIEKGGVNCGWPIYEGIDQEAGYAAASNNIRNQDEASQPSFRSQLNQATSLISNSDAKQRRFVHFPPALEFAHAQDETRYPHFSGGSISGRVVGSGASLVPGSSFRGVSVTAGTYYSGTKFPSNYQNVFFFSDYGTNWIKAASIHDNSSDHQIHEVKDFAPSGYGKGIVDLEYCPLDQSIFYVNINTGDIQRISYGSSNRPPVASASANRTSGSSPLTVNFSSSGSSDPEGGPLSYAWDFGDGTSSTSANPSHIFTSTGSRGFTVTLTVKDNGGLTDSKTIQISTNNSPPSVRITNPVNNSNYSLTQASQITARATVTDNDPTNMKYEWQLFLVHNSHEHANGIVTGSTPTFTISPVGCDGESYSYRIELKVTDNGGLNAQDVVRIFPNCNSATLSISNLRATAQNGSVVLNWTNPSVSFDGIMVVAKANSGFISNPSGTNYTSNTNFTSVSSAFEGGKVVYTGTGTSTTVTGLTNGTRYYFRVFSRKGSNWTGGIETSAVPNSNSSTTLTPTPSTFDLTKCYSLTARHSNKVMEIASNSTANGVNVRQATWNGSRNQVWRIKSKDGVYHRMVNGYSGSVLDVKSVSLADKANIQQHTYLGTNNQLWRFDRNTEGYYLLVAKHSGKVADVSANSAAEGANIAQFTKNNGTNQQWRVVEVTCPSGTIAFAAAQIYAADGYKEGRKAVLNWISNAYDADYFTIEKMNTRGVFEAIDIVNAKPIYDINEKINYYYIDNQALEGENVYRITLATLDATETKSSKNIVLNFNQITEFALFPNPAFEYIDVDLASYLDKKVTLSVVDVLGHIFKNKTIEKAEKIQRVDLDNVPDGQYILRIQTEGKRDVLRMFNITH